MAKTLPPRILEAVNEVIDYHNQINNGIWPVITLEDILGDQRKRYIAWARQECCWRIRDMKHPTTGQPLFSLPKIGRWFSVDHTTVLHAVRRVEQRRAENV